MELVKIIKERGLTIAQAAAEIGITRAYLYQIIRGKHVGRRTAALIATWSSGRIDPASLILRGTLSAGPHDPTPIIDCASDDAPHDDR